MGHKGMRPQRPEFFSLSPMSTAGVCILPQNEHDIIQSKEGRYTCHLRQLQNCGFETGFASATELQHTPSVR